MIPPLSYTKFPNVFGYIPGISVLFHRLITKSYCYIAYTEHCGMDYSPLTTLLSPEAPGTPICHVFIELQNQLV